MKNAIPFLLLFAVAGCFEEGAIQVGVVVCEEVLCAGYCAATNMGADCFLSCLDVFDGACAEDWTHATACMDLRQSVILCAPEFAAFDNCVAAQITNPDGGADGSRIPRS